MKKAKTPDAGPGLATRRSTFAKYRGIGTPGIRPGRKGIVQWLRKLRGQLKAIHGV